MTLDLEAAFPAILPHAVAWAEDQACVAATAGQPLDDDDRALARAVGVQDPGSVRVMMVDAFAPPDHPLLREAARVTGLLGPDTIGLALGYSVLIRRGFDSRRLRSHEFRHVQQYESAGSMEAFLRLYLRQVLTYGYHDAPFEVDARRYEIGA